ncbi:MAG TPA: GNAT family N-acetyltransferase [Candidatus Limnocylindrales bacterium]|nr:GNAT family N-acetyltransferase [Candidatus Limnocylindrales bacterium]
MTEPRDATPAELEDWDARAVDAPGGHVYQSRGWAEHRASQGWRPRFMAWDDGERALVLTRGWPILSGGSGYVPRGPRPVLGQGASTAARLVAIARRLEDEGLDVVAADPEVPAADRDFAAGIVEAGFAPIEEIQPSRHRLTRPLAGLDEDAALAGIAKSTRQRIRKADASGIVVARHDTGTTAAGPGEGFCSPWLPSDAALDRFYDLLLATGERRRFTFGPRSDFVAWWRRALAAGHLVYLEAWAPGAAADDEPLAGLILYRHGRRLSTVHSGDRETGRRDHPGALHLLRWRALQLAIREGRDELDLGGADVAGARREPRAGESMWGLYEHKRSFGGQWLELTGAHERVARPWRYALGRGVAAGRRRLPLGRLGPSRSAR